MTDAPARLPASRKEPISPRELQILHLIGSGLSNKDIAADLGLTLNTVKTYIRTSYRKIGVTTRAQAILWWVAQRDVLDDRTRETGRLVVDLLDGGARRTHDEPDERDDPGEDAVATEVRRFAPVVAAVEQRPSPSVVSRLSAELRSADPWVRRHLAVDDDRGLAMLRRAAAQVSADLDRPVRLELTLVPDGRLLVRLALVPDLASRAARPQGTASGLA